MAIGATNAGGGSSGRPQFTYTGNHALLDDGNRNWRIKFLTSGTLTIDKDTYIDVFMTGGGGGGAKGHSASPLACRGGNGAYYANTSIMITAGTEYTIVVGAGGVGSSVASVRTNGGTTSAFGISAAGAESTDGSYAISGGCYQQGLNGADGVHEFLEDANPTMYCGGGGCGSYQGSAVGIGGAGGGANGGQQAEDNSGGGGGGGSWSPDTNGRNGGSGIVIIRNQREAAA